MKQLLIFFFIVLLAVGCGKGKKAIKDPDVYYTCSMHPQVISDKPGKCPICHMTLTPVRKSEQKETASDELKLSDQQVALGNIKTDTIRSGAIGNQMILTATLNFDQSKRTSVSARVMGRIEKLYFKNIGDYVSKGAPLYELYSEELNNAKQEYLLALERRKLFTDQSVIDFDALIESARNKLRLWGMTGTQINSLAKSGKAPLTTTYFSTESGYITDLTATEGAYVMEGGTIVQLADLSSLWAEAQVYSSQLSNIAPNSIATVQVPGTTIKELKGRIDFSNPEVNPNSRINLIRVTLPNPDHQLKPGMPAYLLLSSPTRSTITLPVDAVIKQANMATVWLETAPNIYKSRMVTLGEETDNQVEITSGLQVGDVVVTNGAYLLSSEFVFKHGENPMAGHQH